MIGLVLALAAAPAELEPLERCRAAVHGALETAAQACQVPSAPVNLWAPPTAADRCRGALERGRMAGESARGLPANMRAGLVRHFDEAYAACTAPPAPATTPPVRKVPRLWD